MVTPFDVLAWVVDRHYDFCMTVVVEARTLFGIGEDIAAEVELWLYRNHKPL